MAQNFYITSDEKYAHITKDDRKPLADEIDRLNIWLNSADNAQKSLQTFNDPVISCEEVQQNIQALSNVYNTVASKPKPAPKKEEKPAEQKPAAAETEAADSSKMDIEK